MSHVYRDMIKLQKAGAHQAPVFILHIKSRPLALGAAGDFRRGRFLLRWWGRGIYQHENDRSVL